MPWEDSFAVDRCPKTLAVRLQFTNPDRDPEAGNYTDKIQNDLAQALSDRPETEILDFRKFDGKPFELAKILSKFILKDTFQEFLISDPLRLQTRKILNDILQKEVKATGVSTVKILGSDVAVLNIIDFSRYLSKLTNGQPKPLQISRQPTKQVSTRKKSTVHISQTLKSYSHRLKIERRRQQDELRTALDSVSKPSDLRRNCYICHSKPRISDISRLETSSNSKLFEALSHYRGKLCKDCAAFNFEKRSFTTNLNGKVALVTGGRIKIGFEITIKLLRAGCKVIVTTRFKDDAVRRFRGEEDYEKWKDNLYIYEVDFRDFKGIYNFTTWFKKTFTSLHILINNAAQTIDRPDAFYQNERTTFKPPSIPVVENIPSTRNDDFSTDIPTTKTVLNKDADEIVTNHLSESTPANSTLRNTENPISPSSPTSSPPQTSNTNDKLPSNPGPSCPAPATNINLSSTIATASTRSNPLATFETYFPLGIVDEFGQQLDLRGRNSWSARLADVPIRELLQVFAINAVAPFILVQELAPLMETTAGRKFIVNVSAMEGQFSRSSKTDRHPHTNMAKAALNMFTRTTGLELKSRDIFMTAVDTGWVTDERPFHQAQHEKTRKGFMVPLDCLDGAARVLDPIIRGCTEERLPDYAVFLKDYKVHPW